MARGIRPETFRRFLGPSVHQEKYMVLAFNFDGPFFHLDFELNVIFIHLKRHHVVRESQVKLNYEMLILSTCLLYMFTLHWFPRTVMHSSNVLGT